MWIVRVNMTDKKVALEESPAAYKNLAGRGFTSTIVSKEVPPLCHALGPSNKLVFAGGIVTGTSAPTSSRISVGAKSPLTGGIKESNAGTSWAADLAVMQVKGLIVEGQPTEKGKYWGIFMSVKDGKPSLEFFDAQEYTGKPLPEIFPKIYERFGEKISICSIGMASEHGYSNSGIVFNDQSKHASRYSGRGGLGAVMASKGLKFIVLAREGAKGVDIVDPALFDQGRKKMIDALRTHAITKPKGGLNSYGTAILVNILNEAGGLPTRNFSSGRFEGAPKDCR